MIDHQANRLALRARALTLQVCTTGSTTLSATATGYARSSGSFITDGFRAGMEVTASGFSKSANNQTAVVTGVTATALTCDGTTVESAGAGRSISVGLPSVREWENLEPTSDPPVGTPFVREQYVPGPSRLITGGDGATIELTGLYVLHVEVPENTGPDAASGYADALITHFAPRTKLTLPNGDVLRIRGDAGPYPGQLIRRRPDWATLPITFPWRVFTINSN